MFKLINKDKIVMYGLWEDLQYFVEELKKLNPNTIDRRNFKVVSTNGFEEVMCSWSRK